MKDQIEEAERLNMDAVKRGRLVERHPEDPKGPISGLIFARY